MTTEQGLSFAGSVFAFFLVSQGLSRVGLLHCSDRRTVINKELCAAVQ